MEAAASERASGDRSVVLRDALGSVAIA